MPEPGWWDEFFDEEYLRTYLPRLDDEAARGEAEGAIALTGVEPGADVLDAPCGFGRVAVPLARAGYRVTGVDLSDVQLDEARRRARGAEWPRLVAGDLRELPFAAGSFDVVLNLFSSLGYAGERADAAILGHFHRVLRPGGRLVVETMHRDRLAGIFAPHTWERLPDGSVFLQQRSFDQLTGWVTETHTVLGHAGARSERTFHHRLYTATELARLLEAAGFRDVEAFGGYGRAPLGLTTRLVLLGTAG